MTVSEPQRVHLVKSKEEHDQIKADLVKVDNDFATNDVGMKSALEGAFAELSGTVKDLRVHRADAAVKLGQSLIRELDPKLTSLEENIAAVPPQTAPGAAPGLGDATKFAEVEACATLTADRLERLEGPTSQIRSTTEAAITELRSVSGPT